MRMEILKIGDVKVFDTPVVMKCYGLKTCIGLFVKDRMSGVTGGAHIFMPEAGAYDTALDVPSALESIRIMLSTMKHYGASLETLRAKLAGGAIADSLGVGTRNTNTVVNALVENKVFIAAMDVGGSNSRTVRFIAESGQMEVRQLETNETITF